MSFRIIAFNHSELGGKVLHVFPVFEVTVTNKREGLLHFGFVSALGEPLFLLLDVVACINVCMS